MNLSLELDYRERVVLALGAIISQSLSISGLNTGRRCPIELRLQKYNGPWRCTVSLRFTVDNDGHPINEPKTIKFGQSINRIEEVEERIRRAQIAILNPSMSFNDPKRYLSSTFGENPATEIAFSYNTVVVLVEGVNMTDLTFCDLPGKAVYTDMANQILMLSSAKKG